MIEVLLALGPLVISPLGFRLLGYEFLRSSITRFVRLGAATLAVLALFPEPSSAIGILALPWFAFTSYAALRSLLNEGVTLGTFACAYLAFGAGWFVLSVSDLQPVGLSATIVVLTAVHFHYAGFGALLVADATTTAVPDLGKFPAFGIAAAMPLVAIGFTGPRVVGVLGIVLLVLSLASVAVLAAIYVKRSGRSLRRHLLIVGSATILVGMTLALHYGVGTYVGFATLSIDRMAQTHGLANAIFVLTGLWGWSVSSNEKGLLPQ
jgi:hypothetical protein